MHRLTGRRQTTCLFIGILTSVFASHFFLGVSIHSDSRWTVHTARSILQEGNTDLDEYRTLLEHDTVRITEEVGGHHYQIFPIGAALLTVPVVAVLDPILPVAADSIPALDRFLRSRTSWEFDEVNVISISLGVERLVASLVTGLTAAILFLTARMRVNTRDALLVAILFAFATPAWSIASRAMWQHGPSMLCLSVATYALLNARKQSWWIAAAGAALAFAFIVRPTNAIPVLVWTVLIAIRQPKQFYMFVLAALPFAIAFVTYNYTIYGQIFAPYYLPQRVGATGTLGEALAANLVSPGRGLFVYSPIFVLSIVGMLLRWRTRTFDSFDASVIAIFAAHWVLVSSFPHWWAGHCYGPRFMSDMSPLLLYAMLPVLSAVPRLAGPRRLAAVAGVLVLATLSVYMHGRGALVSAGWQWNATPVPLDESHERLWDWTDPAFLRPLETR